MPRRLAGDFPSTATNFFEQGLNSLTMWGCPPGFVQFQDSCIPAEETGENQVTTSEEVTEISRLDQLFIKAVNENTEEAWDEYRKEHQKFRTNILTKFWKTKIKSQRVAKMGAQELLTNDPTREPLDVLNEWRRAILHLEELVEDIPKKLVQISELIDQREKDGNSSGK